jgi:hypothetical protein
VIKTGVICSLWQIKSRIMLRWFVTSMKRIKRTKNFSLKARDYFEDVGVGRRIILKRIWNKCDVSVWADVCGTGQLISTSD